MDNSNNRHLETGNRCAVCQQFFPRIRKNQKTCGETICRKKRKRDQEKAWIERCREEEGKSYYQGGYDRVREWRKAHPDYQRRWRAKRKGAEIHNGNPPANPLESMVLRLRLPTALQSGEIQTLSCQLKRLGSDSWVYGGG